MIFARGDGKPSLSMERVLEQWKKQQECLWCRGNKGYTELQFSIIDDDFCQYVHRDMIKFCPFCGRELNA